MEEIINWLLEIEDAACKFYEKAVAQFPDDKEIADFVRHLGEEEKRHYELISGAYELSKDKYEFNNIVSLDKDAIQDIEDSFRLIEKKIGNDTLTKSDMISCIIAIEYSECNHLFLHVMNTLKNDFSEFIPAAIEINKHKKHIQHFLESHPEYKEYREDMRSLIDIWQDKILVVDDDVATVALLEGILNNKGDVKNASNGEKALKMLGDEYFAAIVTDVDMPVMNGMEFYNKAVDMYPNVKERFLFFTGSLDDESQSFLKGNNLKHLVKPATITEVKNAVARILYR